MQDPMSKHSKSGKRSSKQWVEQESDPGLQRRCASKMLEVTPDIQHRSNPLGMDDTQKINGTRERT